MTCNPMLGPTTVVLEYSGLLESRAKKRASPVTIPIHSIERVERVDSGVNGGGEWCRIRVYGEDDPPNLAFDPLAFVIQPQHEQFVAQLISAVTGEPMCAPQSPPVSAQAPPRERPYERPRTSAFDWLFEQ